MKHQAKSTTLRPKTRITFLDLFKEVKKLFPVFDRVKENILTLP
jgi:hypothetical protein